MGESRARQGLSTSGRVLIYCVLVVAFTVIGFVIGNSHANAVCNSGGGDCEILVLLIIYWTFGAFVVSLLAIITAEIVRRLRSRRARLG
jgi:hypothetical protein